MTSSPGILDFPDDPAELAPWLERKLVGIDLALVIAQLETVHGAGNSERSETLEDLLGDRLDDMLQSGLRVVPRPALSALLRQPRRLLDLQEQVLRGGGSYWQSLSQANAEVAPHVARSKQALETMLRGEFSAPAEVIPLPAATPRRAGRWLLLWAIVSTVAASMLAVITANNLLSPSRESGESISWGWNSPAAFAPAVSRQAYLEQLARYASEWFKIRPSSDDPDTFARRLGEFRTACSRLILARHESLPPQDRDWLIERCKKWSQSLDQIRDTLEQAAPTDRNAVVNKARADADAITSKLVKALEERSKQVT